MRHEVTLVLGFDDVVNLVDMPGLLAAALTSVAVKVSRMERGLAASEQFHAGVADVSMTHVGAGSNWWEKIAFHFREGGAT